jgi:hypothetical protein
MLLPVLDTLADLNFKGSKTLSLFGAGFESVPCLPLVSGTDAVFINRKADAPPLLLLFPHRHSYTLI